MDNPAASLFQDAIENPQSKEEDEELEEQRRRQEELEDLLTDGIQGFKYDDSTINSSTNASLISYDGVDPNTKQLPTFNPLEFKFDEMTKHSLTNGSTTMLDELIDDNNYKNASHADQLKVLYDVRVREINNLRQEFSHYKDEKVKEISVLKTKLTLSEAEIRHMQVSMTNLESLLVEKTDTIKMLNQNVTDKNNEIETLQKSIEEMKFEICSYKSTVNELQLKEMDSNPFSAGSRKYQLDENQKSQQQHILKLEALLQEQNQKSAILAKDKQRLEDDVKKLIKADEENNVAIIELSKKLHSSQQQCKDLFMLGEAIKKESDHFKERLRELNSSADTLFEDNYVGQMDNKTLMVQLERLKRMILDKDTELSTLKAKLKFYETDMNELFEYRELMSTIRNNEFDVCNNKEHQQQLILMQKQLQNYKEMIEERNKEIVNLHLVNKESREKIEEMLQQTRNEIRTLSDKYSLPQLEKMSNDLRLAEKTINELRNQMEDNTRQEKSGRELIVELEKAHQQIGNLQQKALDDRQNFEEMLAILKQDLKRSEDEVEGLKQLVEDLKASELQLRNENATIQRQLEDVRLKLPESETEANEFKSLKSEYGQLKEQLRQVMRQLEKLKSKETDWSDCIKVIIKLKKKISKYSAMLGQTGLKPDEIEHNLKSWDAILSSLIERFKNLNASQFVIDSDSLKELELREQLEELANTKNVLEGEKFALEVQVKRYTHELEEARKSIGDLLAKNNNLNYQLGESSKNLQELKRELISCQDRLKVSETDKVALEQVMADVKRQLDAAKQESIQLQKELGEIGDKAVRRNLYEELKDVESDLEKSRTEVDTVDVTQKTFQAEVLKAELKMRERLQEENMIKLQDIEARYKKVLNQSTEFYNKEIEKLKGQELTYRQQIAFILDDCSKKVMLVEEDNEKLTKRIINIVKEHETYKKNVYVEVNKYQEKLAQSKYNLEIMTKQWENFVQQCLKNYRIIERQCQKRMDVITTKLGTSQSQVDLIEKTYDERINKFKAKNAARTS